MIITFSGEHKSISSFKSDILQKFTVITGKNGCGKSQLIEILTLKASDSLPPLLDLTIDPEIKNIQAEGIEKLSLSALGNDSWKSKVDSYINEFISIKDNTKKLSKMFLNADTWIDKLTVDNIFSILDEEIISRDNLELLFINSLKELEPDYFKNTNPTFHQVFNRFISRKHLVNEYKTALVANFVANYRDKHYQTLIDSDFYLTPIPEYFLDSPKLFGSRLDYVFYNYAKRRDQNRRLYFEKKEEGEKNNSTPDSDFIKEFIPPWDSINSILKIHGVEFKFKGLEKGDFSSDASITFQLVKTTIDKDIDFQHLSSGEKVIIGLIAKLFTCTYYEDKLEFPELIILDEPDAHLHPEMSKLLIDVLNDTFVKELGIYVIMVTHSPATVALCPDNSIYQLINEPTTSLKSVEKEDALELLTGHLPTLSIDYKNHKQVFVESPTDVKYYQTIFNKLNEENKYPFKLYFISNSYGKGNCQQVINIVEKIRSSANTTCFGIVDWDLKNKTTDFIKVHGFKNRYSIENYLYDPIFLAVLLMTLRAHDIYKEIGFEETYNQYSIGTEDEKTLQRIADWFFSKYYEEFSVQDSERNSLGSIEYFNGKKISVPRWFLEFNGHDFEDCLKKIFPSLDGKYSSEGVLQKEITLIIGKCYPFIPKDSEILIEEIIRTK